MDRLRRIVIVVGLGSALIAAPANAKSISGVATTAGLCPVSHVILGVNYDCAIEFSAAASNGYRVTVSASPGQNQRPGTIELSATRGAVSATYTARGPVSAKGFRASFGSLGQINVRFHPSGRTRHKRLPKPCYRNRPPVVSSRLGSFRGTIRFHGELGYTKLDLRSASGGIGDPITNTAQRRSCDLHESPKQIREELKAVTFQARRNGLLFQANRAFGALRSAYPDPGQISGPVYLFTAFVSEPRTAHHPATFRDAFVLGPGSDFTFDSGLTQAILRPPPPFSGSATFTRESSRGYAWDGDLSVSLPGLAPLSLTASGIEARLGTLSQWTGPGSH